MRSTSILQAWGRAKGFRVADLGLTELELGAGATPPPNGARVVARSLGITDQHERRRSRRAAGRWSGTQPSPATAT